MKRQRQIRILELIKERDIRTQDEITRILQKEGFRVTQATVSRDLRELHLTKNHSSKSEAYCYCSNSDGSEDDRYIMNVAMLAAIESIKYSMNNVVIKTLPGLAQAVASNVDALNLPEILGSVAGDDTIIIVTTDEGSSKYVINKINEMGK